MTEPARRPWVALVLAVPALAGVAWHALHPPAVALMQLDSSGYVEFAATRSPGYPLFLRAVQAVAGGLDAVPAVQLGLYGAAALFLALGVLRLAGAVPALLILLVTLGNVEIVKFAFMAMTEAPYIALLMAVLGALARWLAGGRAGWLAAAAALTGVAILVRPAGYALLAVLPPAVLWQVWRHRDGWLRAVLVTALPVVAVLAAGATAYHARHGAWATQSFLGSNLIGKAAPLADGTEPSRHPALVRWIHDVTAPTAGLPDAAEDWQARFLLIAPLYDHWRWQQVMPGLAARTGLDPADDKALNALSTELGLDILLAHPMAYAADVALNLWALWTVPDALTPAGTERFQALLAGLEPLPPLHFAYEARARNPVLVYGLRGVLAVALLASLLAVAVVLRRALVRTEVAPALFLAFLAALLAHASLILVAGVQAGLPRYLWSAWPAVMLVPILVPWAWVPALRAGGAAYARLLPDG